MPTGNTESLRIKTFGECEAELTASCETVNLAVGDITGRTRTQVEAFVVPVICAPLGNQEIDRAQVTLGKQDSKLSHENGPTNNFLSLVWNITKLPHRIELDIPKNLMCFVF